jgi:hypothetical protein
MVGDAWLARGDRGPDAYLAEAALSAFSVAI